MKVQCQREFIQFFLVAINSCDSMFVKSFLCYKLIFCFIGKAA